MAISSELAKTTTSVSIAATGDVVTAVASQRVYVYSGVLVAAASVTVTIRDGTTALTGAISLIAGVPLPIPARQDGKPVFTTTLGNALNFLLGGSIQVSGWLETAQG